MYAPLIDATHSMATRQEAIMKDAAVLSSLSRSSIFFCDLLVNDLQSRKDKYYKEGIIFNQDRTLLRNLMIRKCAQPGNNV